MTANELRKPKCYNCKFASDQFKVIKLTHVHCFDEKQYPEEKLKKGDISPWETLRVFSDTCKNHEFKIKR